MDSYDFEEQLIGSMIIKGDHIDCHEITGKLPADAFENFHLRNMYSVISALLSKCEPIDPFTIQEAVPAGTKDMVLTVSSRCKSSANIKAWAKRVRQCWMLRKGESEFIRAAEILRSA
ncbi:DnaB-like helicase N-terminal domain-containing protein, partial [Yersinia pekkanenii]